VKKDPNMNDGLTKGLRWSARVVGLFAIGLFLLFLVESGARIIPALSWSSPRGMPLLIAMIVAALGVLVAWRWELVGGAMAVVGAVAIFFLVYAGGGAHLFRAALILIVPLVVPGILFLVCHLRTRPSPPSEEVLITEAYSGDSAKLQANSG
jgi:peptidoglycan/LPS O-acetylase OafA/YrhL